MADNDRIGSHSVRMTSEEIVQRGFASKVRGLAEADVRSFLKRVAEEVERLGKREDELLSKISDMQATLSSKPKASKAELLESLGEQTTRVLSSAEEAAEQMVVQAKEESQKALANAKEKSDQLASEARKKADDLILKTENQAKSLEERAKRDSEMVIAQARTKGRELFQESVVVRERILKDLLKRRDLLIEQIDELRNGREELLDSYKVVKSSFQKATDALQSVEHRATSELEENPIDVDELLKAPVELPSALDPSKPLVSNDSEEKNAPESSEMQTSSSKQQSDKGPITIYDQTKEDDQQDPESIKVKEEISLTGKRKTLKKYVKEALGSEEVSTTQVSDSRATTVKPEQERELSQQATGIGEVKNLAVKKDVAPKKDVGALFESLKSQKEDTSANNMESISSSPDLPAQSDEPSDVDLVEEESTEAAQAMDTEKSKKTSKKKSTVKKDPVALRNDALNGITSTILRKAKRQLQDEQNELLESLRTVKSKKRISSISILPEEQTQIKNWTESLRTELEEVFLAGAKTVSGKEVQAGEEVLKSSVHWIISPLRETLIVAVDEGEASESGTRVGAKYREWRNSDLKNALYDALCCAYNNGVLNAAEKDATMKWEVEKAGQCPDCDDNALEPTASGESFPTGQIAPPAHSGCRCVIAIA